MLEIKVFTSFSLFKPLFDPFFALEHLKMIRQQWANPVILKNGDGIFPLRAAQRRVKEIKIPCES